MFHILRRIRHSLLETNRFRKYALYAVGEIALVMIGILLALQVNNWNEGRKQKAEETAILYDLLNEFKSNHDKFIGFYNYKRDIKEKWDEYLDQISNLSAPPERRAIKRPNNGAIEFNPSQSVINSILSSGKLDILSDDSLKYELSNWGNVINEFKEIERRHVNHVEGALRNYEFENRVIEVYAGPNWSFESPFYKNYSSRELNSRMLTINEDLEYQNILLLNYMWLKLSIQRSENLDRNFEKVINLIQTQIKSR